MFFYLFWVAFLLLVLYLYLDSRKPRNYPPGPNWLPMIGNLLGIHKSLTKLKYLHLVWSQLATEYGNIVGLRLGLFRVVVVSGLENIRQVLTKNEFIGRPDGFLFRFRSFGKRYGLVFTEGTMWQHHRRFCLKYLREVGLGRTRMDELIMIEAEEIITALHMKMKETGFVEMQSFFDVAVLNVLWTMVAGHRFQIGDEKLGYLLHLLHKAFKLIDTSGGILNQLPILRYVAPNKTGYLPLKSTLNQIYAFLRESVKEHRDNLSTGSYEMNDLMSAYIREIDDTNHNVPSPDTQFTDEQLLVVLLDLFMAGSETTSGTLDFIMLYLIHFPECQARAHQQLKIITSFNRNPSLKDRPSLSYIDAFISEVQRHASNIPLGISHRAMQDVELNGFLVPKDTIVFTNFYSLNSDKKYWTDPHVFRPERFLNEKGQLLNHEYFIPFGSGPRRCLGETLARGTLFLFVASILNNFTISSPSGVKPPALTAVDGITLTTQPFRAVLTPHN